MSYRTNDTMTLILIAILGVGFVGIGLLGRRPDLLQDIWWVPVVVGAGILLTCLVGIGFVASQPTEIPCPYCKEKIVPKVRTASGHLYLSRLDKD